MIVKFLNKTPSSNATYTNPPPPPPKISNI